MIKGFSIISQEPIMTTPIVFWFCPLFFLFAFLIGCKILTTKKISYCLIYLFLSIIFFIIGIKSALTYQKEFTGRYFYTIKIENASEIDWQLYNDKYIELNQIGDIRVIKERE